mmetsp:Transcript_42340/g.132740  ORF Transcript_42340/g.132740 Transcript_42340/m.132740 type:complete len:99 (-) Transcript_42340:188-484(-)
METFVRTSILGDGEHEPAGAATEYAWARADWDARGGDWSFGYFYGTDEEKQVQAILAAPPEAGAAFTEDEVGLSLIPPLSRAVSRAVTATLTLKLPLP